MTSLITANLTDTYETALSGVSGYYRMKTNIFGVRYNVHVVASQGRFMHDDAAYKPVEYGMVSTLMYDIADDKTCFYYNIWCNRKEVERLSANKNITIHAVTPLNIRFWPRLRLNMFNAYIFWISKILKSI